MSLLSMYMFVAYTSWWCTSVFLSNFFCNAVVWYRRIFCIFGFFPSSSLASLSTRNMNIFFLCCFSANFKHATYPFITYCSCNTIYGYKTTNDNNASILKKIEKQQQQRKNISGTDIAAVSAVPNANLNAPNGSQQRQQWKQKNNRTDNEKERQKRYIYKSYVRAWVRNDSNLMSEEKTKTFFIFQKGT